MDTMNINANNNLSESILIPDETLPENGLNSDENLSENELNSDENLLENELNSDGNLSEQSSNFKSKFSKKKIGIIIGVSVLLIILAIVIFRQIGENTTPFIPSELEFGMSMDEISTAMRYDRQHWNDYDLFDKRYSLCLLPGWLDEDIESDFLECCPPGKSQNAYWTLFLYCNEMDQLYGLDWTPSFRENEDPLAAFQNVCTFLEKNLGEGIHETTSVGDYEKFTFSGNDFDVEISRNGSVFRIEVISEKYKPEIPEISDEAILSALNDYVYDAGGFAVPLPTLVNKCMKNQRFTPIPVSSFTPAVKQLVLETYSEHASTSYLVTCYGDICQNPQVPWMLTKDITILQLLLIFDDNGNLVDSKVIDSCDELNTCATILFVDGL